MADEFWGYLQEDVLLGDLRLCFTPQLLQSFDIVSPFTSPLNASGVLMLLRNTPSVNRLWRRSTDAHAMLRDPRYLGESERLITYLRASGHSRTAHSIPRSGNDRERMS